jgi:hypothetical protein
MASEGDSCDSYLYREVAVENPMNNTETMHPAMPIRPTRRSRRRQVHRSRCRSRVGTRIWGVRPLGTIRALGDGISRDPLGEPGFRAVTDRRDRYERSQENSLYAFVCNNPLTVVDLLGLSEEPPVPPNNRAPEGCNIGCCTADKIKEGKDELIARFNEAKALLDGWGIKRDPDSEDGSSCHESNQNILQYMTPSPPCWTCAMERRWFPGSKPGVLRGSESSDENFIVCVSHPKTGKGESIIFDWYEARPAGESYTSFASDHPYFEERGGWYTYNDCTHTMERQPKNKRYLETLKK